MPTIKRRRKKSLFPRINGKAPRNKFERDLFEQLLKAKIKFDYESEKISYTLTSDYIPDFVIHRPGVFSKQPLSRPCEAGGRTDDRLFIEGKGQFDASTRRKMLAVKRQNPELDIRFVFYNSNAKIGKGNKMTHGEWATKNGFLFAHRDIPVEWLS